MLPVEVLMHLASELASQEQLQLMCCCRQLHAALMNDQVWQQRLDLHNELPDKGLTNNSSQCTDSAASAAHQPGQRQLSHETVPGQSIAGSEAHGQAEHQQPPAVSKGLQAANDQGYVSVQLVAITDASGRKHYIPCSPGQAHLPQLDTTDRELCCASQLQEGHKESQQRQQQLQQRHQHHWQQHRQHIQGQEQRRQRQHQQSSKQLRAQLQAVVDGSGAPMPGTAWLTCKSLTLAGECMQTCVYGHRHLAQRKLHTQSNSGLVAVHPLQRCERALTGC